MVRLIFKCYIKILKETHSTDYISISDLSLYAAEYGFKAELVQEERTIIWLRQ